VCRINRKILHGTVVVLVAGLGCSSTAQGTPEISTGGAAMEPRRGSQAGVRAEAFVEKSPVATGGQLAAARLDRLPRGKRAVALASFLRASILVGRMRAISNGGGERKEKREAHKRLVKR
jgi:sirohydrochlorin ferrochelatase